MNIFTQTVCVCVCVCVCACTCCVKQISDLIIYLVTVYDIIAVICM